MGPFTQFLYNLGLFTITYIFVYTLIVNVIDAYYERKEEHIAKVANSLGETLKHVGTTMKKEN